MQTYTSTPSSSSYIWSVRVAVCTAERKQHIRMGTPANEREMAFHARVLYVSPLILVGTGCTFAHSDYQRSSQRLSSTFAALYETNKQPTPKEREPSERNNNALSLPLSLTLFISDAVVQARQATEASERKRRTEWMAYKQRKRSKWILYGGTALQLTSPILSELCST